MMTDTIELGHAADRLLKDEAVKVAFAALETEVTRAWAEAADPGDRDVQWYRLRALKELQQKLIALRDAGTRKLRET